MQFRFTNSSRMMPHPLNGWVPVNLDPESGKFFCVKVEGRLDLGLPFFSQSIRRHIEQSSKAQLGRCAIEDCAGFPHKVTPAGMIFHASRCGSTVLSRSLQQLANCTVIAEAPLINAVLQRKQFSASLFGDAVNVLGQFHENQSIVLKHSSQNSLFLQKALANYSDMPWIFVYRHPVEIMVSIGNRGTAWSRAYQDMARAAVLLGMDEAELCHKTFEQYLALVLGRYFERVLDAPAPGRLLINYNDIDEVCIESAAGHFGLTITQQERQAISQALQQYSKNPDSTQQYVPDTERKQKEASAAIQDAAEEIIPLYDALESSRKEAVESSKYDD